MTRLHWFRNDLRIHDNPALYAACEDPTKPVAAIYVRAPEQWRSHDWSERKCRLLDQQLLDLKSSLAGLNIPLLIFTVSDFDAQRNLLLTLCRELHADSLFFNEEYAVNERRRDQLLTQALQSTGVTVRRFRDQSILPVGSVLTKDDKPYSVFSPFKRNWQAQAQKLDLRPLPKPGARQMPWPEIPASLKTDVPKAQADPLWPAGESRALDRLASFCDERVMRYHSDRDYPATDGTSALSPYLALGILSGRQCLAMALQAMSETPSASHETSTWINELIWRDFYIHILYHNPSVSRHKAYRPETDQLQWRGEGPLFNAWCEARTGIPIVDAAMRQLLNTGWMHNRLRMVVAMFLTKNLFVDWRLGERFFMQHLVDGYLPANNGGWQWSASTGTDAAPYFRVFNPVSQSQKFDPMAKFIRQWMPEISGRDDKSIHQPLSNPLPGIDYPTAIVDLKTSRKEAIENFKALSGQAG